MTATEQQPTAPPEPSYGNWHRTGAGGLYGLGRGGTVLLFAVIIAVITVIMTFGLVPGAVVGCFLGLGMSMLLIRDRAGRNLLMTINTRYRFLRSNHRGTNLLRQGPLTPRADYTLPGILGRTTATEHFDGLGRPFVLLSYRAGYHVVVLNCSPDGSTNVDEDDINQAVAQYGSWLSSHPAVLGLIGATVTVETAPDTGNRLKREIQRMESPDAPELAKQVMAEIRRDYPVGSATVGAWVTLSFAEKGRTGKARGEKARIAAMGASLGTEIPELTHNLTGTGAGAVVPMDVQGLCEVVRVAYDPAAGAVVEEARAQGVPVEALSWDQAGPVACQALWDHLQHDSGVTVTSVMTLPPRQNVPSMILRRLVQPSAKVLRKRVTIHYRPLPTAQASREVEKDLSNAVFARNAASKKTAAHDKAIQMAEATAREEAHGAGLDDFALVISATAAPEHLEDARTVTGNLAASARLQIRTAYGAQDSAFALTLPVGLDPSRHIRTPRLVKAVTR